jgi:hypothetical protein
MLPFWNTLYANVLLEFMYVNKLSWPVPRLEVARGVGNERDGEGPRCCTGGVEVKAESGESAAATDSAARKILLPLGGKSAHLVPFLPLFLFSFLIPFPFTPSVTVLE